MTSYKCEDVCIGRVDEEEGCTRPIALSDTEVEVCDRRSVKYWEHKKSRRNDHSSKVSVLLSQGEASPHTVTTPSGEELRDSLKQHESMVSGEW